MVILLVSVGILVVLGVLGYVSTRQRAKNRTMSWDSRRDALDAHKDSEDTTQRPGYGSLPYQG